MLEKKLMNKFDYNFIHYWSPKRMIAYEMIIILNILIYWL